MSGLILSQNTRGTDCDAPGDLLFLDGKCPVWHRSGISDVGILDTARDPFHIHSLKYTHLMNDFTCVEINLEL